MGVVQVPSNSDSPSLSAALNDIVQRAVHMTGAQGAAIAVKQENGLVTVASCGDCAPDVGVPVRSTSFAGRCFDQGAALICNDTDTDARVDPTACRTLNIRSMIAVPIRQAGQMRGVLAVFASTPNRFRGGEVGLARTLATITGEMLKSKQGATQPGAAETPQKTPPEEPGNTGRPPAPREASQAAQPAAEARPSRAAMHIVPEQKRETGEPPAPVAAPRGPRAPEPEHAVEVSRPRPAARASKSKGSSSTEVLPTAEEPVAASRPAAHQSSLVTPVLAAYGQRISHPRWRLITALAASLTVAIVAGGWLVRARIAHADKVLSAADASTVPAAGTSAPATPRVDVPGTASRAAKETQAKAATPSRDAESSVRGTAQGTRKAENPPAQPALFVRAAAPSASHGETEVAPPPIMAQPPAPLLAGSPKPYVPSAPVSQLVPPQVLRKVSPLYPASARTLGTHGKVVLNAVVNTDGTIGNVTVVSGNAVLRDAAVKALKQWVYKPAYLNGKPTESTVSVEMNFTLPR